MSRVTVHFPSNNTGGLGALTGNIGFDAVDRLLLVVARTGWFEGGKILA